MSESEGYHFTIHYRGGVNAVAGHTIAILLEEAYISVGGDFDYYLDEKIEAFLYARERFRDITRSPAWAGAIYDGAIKIPAGGITEKTDLLEKERPCLCAPARTLLPNPLPSRLCVSSGLLRGGYE